MIYNPAGKKIFLAGHNGMVGRAVKNSLKNENCEIITASRTELDLTDQAAVNAFLKDKKPDAIIMAAAKVGGIGANMNAPAAFIYDNLVMATNIIHGAHLADIQRILYLGSSCIYPPDAAQPYTPAQLMDGPPEPTNAPYALAKLAGIALCKTYSQQYGRDYIAAIPCNLYGPNDHYDEEESHVIPALIMKIHAAKQKEKTQVVLWGDGTPLREFLYVDDLASALKTLLINGRADAPVNIGSGQEITIFDLARRIAHIIGYDGQIIFDPSRPNGAKRKIMNSAPIRAMGWHPETALDNGLKQAYDDYLNRISESYIA